MPTGRWMIKELYKMDYYLAVKMNASETILMRWMNLEPIIQKEVNQK